MMMKKYSQGIVLERFFSVPDTSAKMLSIFVAFLFHSFLHIHLYIGNS